MTEAQGINEVQGLSLMQRLAARTLGSLLHQYKFSPKGHCAYMLFLRHFGDLTVFEGESHRAGATGTFCLERTGTRKEPRVCGLAVRHLRGLCGGSPWSLEARTCWGEAAVSQCSSRVSNQPSTLGV